MGWSETARSEGVEKPFKIHHSVTAKDILAGHRAILGLVGASWPPTTATARTHSLEDRNPQVNQPLQGTDTAEYGRFADEVTARLDSGRRVNTVLAREQDWKWWRAFCADRGITPWAVSEYALAAYAGALADGTGGRLPLAPASILRRISGVVAGWREADLMIPERVSEAARKVVANHERKLLEDNLPTGRGPAPALELRGLRRISQTLPDDTGGIRDRALILVGFGIGARRSELAHLDVSDIRETSEGLDVRVRFSKTKPRNPGVPFGSLPETCPVQAWRDWQSRSGVEDGAAFRQVTCHGHVGGRMSPRAVGEAIRRAGDRAALEQQMTGHSLRAGMATEARRAGRDIVEIARQGGWSETSDSLYRYIRTVDKWRDNAMRGVL